MLTSNCEILKINSLTWIEFLVILSDTRCTLTEFFDIQTPVIVMMQNKKCKVNNDYAQNSSAESNVMYASLLFVCLFVVLL